MNRAILSLIVEEIDVSSGAPVARGYYLSATGGEPFKYGMELGLATRDAERFSRLHFDNDFSVIATGNLNFASGGVTYMSGCTLQLLERPLSMPLNQIYLAGTVSDPKPVRSFGSSRVLNFMVKTPYGFLHCSAWNDVIDRSNGCVKEGVPVAVHGKLRVNRKLDERGYLYYPTVAVAAVEQVGGDPRQNKDLGLAHAIQGRSRDPAVTSRGNLTLRES